MFNEATWRGGWAAAIAVSAGAALLLAYLTQGESEPQPFAPSPFDMEMDKLERQALDDAFRAQMASLFSVWLKDPTSGPARAITGAGHARKAYTDVKRAIEAREHK
jgi:hypothetical protein